MHRKKKTKRIDDPQRVFPGAPPPESLTPLLRPIERVAVNEQILSRLREFLEHKHLKVGSKLPSERQLTSMLKVSRNSVREALRALAILGVVRPRQGKGTYLAASLPKPLNRPSQILGLQESSDIIELWELRVLVEPYVASLTAVRGSEDDWQSISEAVEAMSKCLTSHEEFQRHDMQFHLRVAKGCGNDMVRDLASLLIQIFFDKCSKLQILDYARDVPRKHGELAMFLAHHQTLLAALRRRSPTLSRSVMMRHLRAVGEYDVRLVRAMAARRDGKRK
jgi:GntR family transcriptional regulator, transcriptional repressor for pyruvate dehydrogenase complex